MTDKLRFVLDQMVSWAERVLAGTVVIGVAVYAISSVPALYSQDWGENQAVYDLVYRILLVAIGLEMARMLVTHDMKSILELLAFVIARKMLKPDLSALDIGVGVLAFVALVLAGNQVFRAGGKGT